jgi:hypothetical protein
LRIFTFISIALFGGKLGTFPTPLPPSCEHEIRQAANTEAAEQFEARVVATLTNLAKQVQGLQTLAHAQVALTDVSLKYVITCVVAPRKMR